MKRPRIPAGLICSSKNYELTHTAHMNNLKRNHEKFVIKEEITFKRQAFVEVFGKLIPVTDEEVLQHKSLRVVYR